LLNDRAVAALSSLEQAEEGISAFRENMDEAMRELEGLAD
jgi:hypothetical protein